MKIKIKISKAASSSAQIVASIDDLLTEILLRLPMKSLIRSKLVSKHWHSLITSPEFCLLRNPNPNPAIGLFLLIFNHGTNPWFEYIPFSIKGTAKNPPFRVLMFTKVPSGIRILQSCNGLLLCCTSMAHDYSRRYYVYNPTTKKFSILPKLGNPGYAVSNRIHGMSLAFDPAKSPHYKTLCVWGLELESGEYQYQFWVYSSETGPWRKCHGPFTITTEVNFENGVYWNGAIHWINSHGDGDSLYFSFDDQMIHIMPLPPVPDRWDWRSNYFFGESCDHLHYIEIVGPQIQFNVYEMKRDYSEWFVKYQVDLSPVVDANPEMIRDYFNPTDWYYYAFSIFTLVRGEKEEDSFLVLQIPGKAIRYNLVQKTFETVCKFERAKDEGSLTFPDAIGFQHIESLCCV